MRDMAASSTGRGPITRPEIAGLGANPIGEVARLAWEVGGVTPLYFGETDLVTPDFIRDAAKRALDEGKTFYTYTGGIPDLRLAIKTTTDRLYGTDIALERILVPGSSMLSVSITLQSIIRHGDNIIIVSPIWPNISLAAQAAGAEVRFAPLGRREDGGWALEIDTIRAQIDGRTRAVFICSPGNPTGWVMRREEQQDLLDLTRSRGLALIADEVYARLVFKGAAAPSFLEIAREDDDLYVINGFSKAWAMTGWRIGWLIHPKGLTDVMTTLSGIANTGATVFAQYGALAALTDPRGEAVIEMMRARCLTGRDIVRRAVAGHNRIRPFTIDGSFYAFLEIEGVTDSLALAKRLVREAKVGVAPGSAFGPGNEAFIRLCFAQDGALLSSALERLTAAL